MWGKRRKWERQERRLKMMEIEMSERKRRRKQVLKQSQGKSSVLKLIVHDFFSIQLELIGVAAG